MYSKEIQRLINDQRFSALPCRGGFVDELGGEEAGCLAVIDSLATVCLLVVVCGRSSSRGSSSSSSSISSSSSSTGRKRLVVWR